MTALIDGLGRVNPALVQLAEEVGLKLPKGISPEAMNAVLQDRWLQRSRFRYQIQGEPPSPKVLCLLDKIGCVGEKKSPDTDDRYDGALLLGTTLSRVKSRLEFLVGEHDRGIVLGEVFLLGSERRLDVEKEESEDQLRAFATGISKKELPTNEIEMMEFVVNYSRIPPGWKITVVRTPDVPLQGAGHRPANTGDTLVQWQKQSGLTDGSFLLVSNQPFVRYQLINARRSLPLTIKITGVGHSANVGLPLATFLDNLAKQFYEELLFFQRGGLSSFD